MPEATTTFSRDVSDAAAADRRRATAGEEAKPKGPGVSAETRRAPGPPRHEVSWDGKAEKVDLLTDSRGEISKLLRMRLGIAQDLLKDQKRLGTIDRLMLQKGEQIVEKFAGVEGVERDELAVAWAVIHDTLIQEASVAGRMVQQEIAEGKPAHFRRLRRIPFFRRFARDEEPGGPVADTAVVRSVAPRLTSDFMEKLHFKELHPDEIETRLNTLNNLRVSVEGQLGFEVSADDWTLPDVDRGGKSRLHNAVVDRMRLILQREHEGKTFVELNEEDPVKAAQARHKAIQEGLMHFSDGFAKSVLIAEKPEVDISKITRQIAEIDKPADPEEAKEKEEAERKARDGKTEAETKRDDARKEHERLQAELQMAKENLKAARRAADQAQKAYDIKNKEVDDGKGGEIGRLEKNIGDLEEMMDTIRDSIRAAVTSKSSFSDPDPDKVSIHVGRQDVIIAQQTQALEGLRGRLEARQTELETLESGLSEADEEKDYWGKEVKRLEGEKQGRKKTKGEVESAKETYDEAEVDYKAKEQALKDLTEPSEDKADRKRALEMWRMIMEKDPSGVLNYEKIIALGFAQGGDEAKFTRDLLGSIEEVDGELEGAELLREYILGTVNPDWDINEKDREIARKMMPDGQIALAIIRTFNIDLTKLDIDYEGGERDAFKKLLPYLKNANQFQIDDMVRFMVKYGLEGAEKGKPGLDIPSRFIETRGETRLDVASILREDMGRVEIGRTEESNRPQITWGGPVREVHGRIFGIEGPADLITGTELNFRVTEEFNLGEVSAAVAVQVNQEFLKNLPPRVSPNMPAQIREQFYTPGGVLKTEVTEVIHRRLRKDIYKQLQTPEWITVSDPVLNGEPANADDARFHETTAIGMLNDLATAYSPEVALKLATQTANEVLEMLPSERAKIINGLADINVSFIDADGDSVDARIRFDNNGNFWIANSDGSQEEELKAYFGHREEGFREDAQVLSTDERQRLKREFGTINQYIGMRIMERMQFIG